MKDTLVKLNTCCRTEKYDKEKLRLSKSSLYTLTQVVKHDEDDGRVIV